MTYQYILDDDDEPVPEPDLKAWAMWIESANRMVARTEVEGVVVSTVFLAVDHGLGHEGAPVLWETMLVTQDERYDHLDLWRYTSRMQALAHHDQVVAAIRDGRQPD